MSGSCSRLNSRKGNEMPTKPNEKRAATKKRENVMNYPRTRKMVMQPNERLVIDVTGLKVSIVPQDGRLVLEFEEK